MKRKLENASEGAANGLLSMPSVLFNIVLSLLPVSDIMTMRCVSTDAKKKSEVKRLAISFSEQVSDS